MDNNCKLASSPAVAPPPQPSAPPTVVTATISTTATVASTTTTFIKPHLQQPSHRPQVQPRPLQQSQQHHNDPLQEHKIIGGFSGQSAGSRTSLSSLPQPSPPPTSTETATPPTSQPHPLPASTQSQTIPQPKVTVSLPKHAASRLRELVQKRDIALLRLGITSVQFEDDQIIPLTLETTTTTAATNSIQHQELQSQQQHKEQQQSFAVYDEDEEEAVSEAENQHGSFNIHQLSQLEFADPIELEMYDNDNLLFPDYTLNLS